jgi:hypothetical protein
MKKFRKKRHQSALTGPIPLPTSAIERSLLLLRAYEGERGVAYLLGTVGVFAPTTVALFLIDRHAYLEMGWSQTLLVVGAVGSMATALLMCGIVVQDLAERQQPVPSDERQRLMRSTLVIGPVLAMFAQFAGLIIALTSRMVFPSYAYTVLLIAAGVAITQGAGAFCTRLRQRVITLIRRRVRTRGGILTYRRCLGCRTNHSERWRAPSHEQGWSK